MTYLESLVNVNSNAAIDGDFLVFNATGKSWVNKPGFKVASVGPIAGITDYASVLQAAINSAGIVFIQPGVYVTGPLTLLAGTILIGAGIGVTVLQLKANSNSHLLSATSANNIVVRDLTLDGNITNQTATNFVNLQFSLCDYCRVQNVRITNAVHIGLAMVGARYGVIENCQFDNWGHAAAAGASDAALWIGTNGAVHSTGTVARNNTFSAYTNSSGAVTIDCDEVTFTYNQLYGAGSYSTPPNGASGVYVGQFRNRVKVVNNLARDWGNYGVDFDISNSVDMYGCVCTGNTCFGCENSGIGFGSNGGAVTGNTCMNNGQTLLGQAPQYPYGLLVDAKNATVSANVCQDLQVSKTQTFGIFLRNISGNTDNCEIIGNNVRNNLTAGVGPDLNSMPGGHNRIAFNDGFNPKGQYTPSFGVPASGTGQTNVLGIDAMVLITGGTVTNVAISGDNTGQTSGWFRIPSGAFITLTYSVAPTWRWYLD